MKEIEIKAHLYDRAALEEQLKNFAHYAGFERKDDAYYAKAGAPDIRIRRQQRDGATEYFITYKRRAHKKTEGGLESEANDEFECAISDPRPLEEFLSDAGFEVYLRKTKETRAWHADVDAGGGGRSYRVTMEESAVPPLGDFVEIEILSEDERDEDAIQAALYAILDRCGVPREQVEQRRYADMLLEAAGRGAEMRAGAPDGGGK